MKRVLSLATTGLFLAGLAMVPMSARAASTDQTVVDGKAAVDGKAVATTHTDPMTAPKMAPTGHTLVTPQTSSSLQTSPAQTSTAPMKKDDKITATPGSSVPAAGTATKAPGKGAS
jgi:hypothetical protein